MLRKSLFIVLLGTFSASFAQQQMPVNDTLELSLEAVIAKLKTDNLHIKASGYELSRAEEIRKAQKGLYYPKIELGATFTQMSDPVELDLTPVRDAILPAYDLIGGQNAVLQNITDYMGANGNLDPATYQALSDGIGNLEQGRQAAVSAINDGDWVETIQDEQFAVVDASILWPIYTGGKIKAANKAAEAKLEISKAKNHQVVSKEITSVVERYFGLRLAMNVADVRKEVLQGMEKHLNDAVKMEENGMLAHAERLHAEVALANAQRELNKSNNMVELMQTALKNSLATNQQVKPTTDLFISPKNEQLQANIDRARESNPALMQLNAQEALSQQGIAKEKSAWYPNVFAFGQADIANYQLSEYMPEWMVGVGLKINLFDGLSKVRKIQAAKMQHMEVQKYQEKANLDIATGVVQVFQQLEQAADNYSSANTSLKFAKEYVRVREKAFSEGFATSTDVVDAQLNLAKVETEILKAKYDYDVALARLLELGFRSEQIVDYIPNTNND